MRRTDPRSAAAWWLLAALYLLVPDAVAADWPWPWSAPHDPRMAAIIAAVRAEEAKYKNIAYVARITVRDSRRKDPANPGEVTTLATRRVVLEGDRTSLRYQAFERVGAVKYRHEETSAYDGERTVTVIAGNCANIHLGRWQHPAIAPAHSLPLLHYSVNFPLSIYLSGTEAIHAHLKYPPGLVQAGAGNGTNIFRRIEAALEGEEQLDGLRCLKVRVYRWFQPNAAPLVQHLWLAPERNYHCVKEEYLWNKMRLHEMRVHELREVAPGVWFPARITVDESQNNGQKQVVVSHSETIVENVDLAPRHELAFFRDVTIPAGLPVFTIKDRRLVGSMLPEPFDDDWGKRKLAELAARVAEQEKRYDNLEVKARTITKYPRSSASAQNIRYDEMSEERSIVRNGLAYSTTHQKIAFPVDWQDTGFRINAYDGQWTRFFWGQGPRDHPQGFGMTLRMGSAKGRGSISVHRPHTPMLRRNWVFGSLSDTLASSPHDPSGQMPFRFRYCGPAEVDGHPCIEVRGDNDGQFNQNNSLVLYLATDRNDIPIKVEQYGNYFGQRLMPMSTSRSGDFREIAPGLWYPFHVTEYGFDIWAEISQGWLVLNWRRDTTIESVAPASQVSEAVFRDVVAPAGANVQVLDEDGNYVNVFQQTEAGVPTLALKRYLELVSDARMNPQQAQARGRAFDAMIGKPAPEFPTGATWLNGRPLTRKDLHGQVVVIGFWAEWNDACRDDLERLEQLHQDRAKSGLAVVGVHPLGSEPAEIKKVIDALHLDFPICVDAEGTSAWGDFFGRFAVRSVPHAVVVNREGTIVAYGPLADVLAKTRVLVQKGR